MRDVAVLLRAYKPKCRECGREAMVSVVEPNIDPDKLQLRIICLHGLLGAGAGPAMAKREVDLDFHRFRMTGDWRTVLDQLPAAIGWPTPPPGPEVP